MASEVGCLVLAVYLVLRYQSVFALSERFATQMPPHLVHDDAGKVNHPALQTLVPWPSVERVDVHVVDVGIHAVRIERQARRKEVEEDMKCLAGEGEVSAWNFLMMLRYYPLPRLVWVFDFFLLLLLLITI